MLAPRQDTATGSTTTIVAGPLSMDSMAVAMPTGITATSPTNVISNSAGSLITIVQGVTVPLSGTLVGPASSGAILTNIAGQPFMVPASSTPAVAPLTTPATISPSTVGSIPMDAASTSTMELLATSTSLAAGMTSSTATATSLPIKSSSNSSLSAGAIAGVAIGCVIVGALLGALLAGILMHRRNRKSRRAGAVHEDVPLRDTRASDEKGVATSTAVALSSASVDSILPLPVQTPYLTQELASIKNLIGEHVSNFYKTEHVGGVSAILATGTDALDDYVSSSPFHDTRQLLDAVADPRTRTDALRYFIALVVLQNIEQSGHGCSDPLLPLGTACCLGNMSSVGFGGSRSDYYKLRSKWRVITGYLQAGHYKQQDFSETDDRTPNVQSVCQTLDTVLAAYAVSAREAARQKHLLSIVRRASVFGTTLAAQPNAYRFLWDHQGGLVLFPSLLQESDETGVELRLPRELGERERARGFPQR